MAGWLGSDENIQGKWGRPPELQAGNIGPTLAAILHNRQVQQQQTQENIANAIKEVQAQRSSRAFLEAAQNAGVLPQGDYGGIDAKSAAALAQLIQAQTPDTQRDALLAAQTREANARAGVYEGGGGLGRGGGDRTLLDENGVERAVGETWIGSDGKERIMTYNRGPKLTAVGLQPSDQRTQNENQMLKEQAGLLEQKGVMDEEKAKQEAADRAAKKANVPYTRSDEYNRTVNRLKQLQQSRVMPSTQPDTGGATGGGADKNLAPGFGKPVSDADVAALGWARAHPDDPRSAAILQKLGIQ